MRPKDLDSCKEEKCGNRAMPIWKSEPQIRIRKVALFARVSTEHEEQLSALKKQMHYHDDLIGRHPDCMFDRRYIDEEISGIYISKRKNFLRMMENTKDGQFNLIVTRGVLRFARDTAETFQQTQLLK